jgi:tetratricopeptide (TPR) repeat protein
MELGGSPEQQADSSATEPSVGAELGGEISGRIAVGDYVVAVHPEHGAIVEVAGRDERPSVRARPAPVTLAPRPGRELLGREQVLERASEAIAAGTPVEVVGPPGSGKTALLRHLAYRGAAPEGGVAYCRAASQPLDDVLAFLFDAFYEADRPYLPTPAELRLRLQARGALILVDDLEADGAGAQALLDSAPACRFVLAATEPRLETGKCELELEGLTEDSALALFERELGRRAREVELDLASAVCRRVGGRPLSVIQAAAAVREGEASLAELAAGGAPGEPEGSATERPGPRAWDGWPGRLDEPQRLALAALVGLGGAPVSPAHVEAIAGVAGADEILEGLRDRGLVEAHGSRYTLAAPVGEESEDRDRWAARALEHFAGWASEADAGQLQEDAEALVSALRWGAAHDRWPEVLVLASALDGPLTLSGRWGSWQVAAAAALEAARAEEGRAAEGWALNQLGVRAACRGETDQAREYLEQALRIREEIEDADGATLTRHNLGVLTAGAPRRGRLLRGPWLALLGAVLGAAGGVAVVLAVGSGGGDGRTTPSPPAATVTTGQPTGRPTPPATAPRETPGRVAPVTPGVTRASPRKPDLVVLRARAVPTGGGSCAVLWTVRNRGRARAVAGATALSYDLARGGSGTASERLPPLAAGAEQDQEKISQGYACGAFASLTVRADPDDRVDESNEANNRRAARLR